MYHFEYEIMLTTYRQIHVQEVSCALEASCWKLSFGHKQRACVRNPNLIRHYFSAHISVSPSYTRNPHRNGVGVLEAFFHFFLGLVLRSKKIFCFTQPKRFLSKQMNERVPSFQ